MRDFEILKDVYDRYAGQMLSVCMRYCPDRSSAEDMMHDGFIKAFKAIDKFKDRGEGSMRAWLSKIMVNTCLQYLRKKDLLRDSGDITTVRNDSIASESELDGYVSEIPESVLLRFIEELPTGYRTVFNLYVFEDLSHKEIATILGINEKSSSSQLHRAKLILAKKVKEYGEKNR